VGKTESGLDYSDLNPKGYVPTLTLDAGEVLTESAAILQYIADLYPEANLAPKAGTFSRIRLQEYLNYTSSELHKAFGPMFSNTSTDQDKSKAKLNIAKKFKYLNALLSDERQFLVDETFTVADAYLFVVSNWANIVGINLDKWPNVGAFVERIAKRPSVKTAMQAEGLI